MPISLGQITFGIGPDTTRLRQSIGDITNFGHAVEAAARAAAAGANSGEAALRRQEAAAIQALQRVQRFQDLVGRSAAPQNLSAGFNQLSTQALDNFVARMTSGRLSAIQFQREMERFNVSTGNANRIFQQWSATAAQSGIGALAANLQKLSSATILVAGPLSGIATRISVVAGLASHFNIAIAGMITGAAGGAYAFYKFGQAAIDVERKLQSIHQTLTAVEGSETLAATTMNYLSGFADKAGVKIDDLAKNFASLEAASKGTILEGERARDIFEAVTMAGSKLALSNEEIKGTLVAVQQIMSKGKISAEELQNQLGDRLPGAVSIMAKAMGVTTRQLQDMMRQGELSISTLTKFADQLKLRYNIDSNTKIDTLVASENKLYNARLRMVDALDKVVGFTNAYKNALDTITNGINGQSDGARKLVAAIGAVAAAFTAAFASSAVIAGVGAITAGIRGLTAAVAGLNFATVAGAGGRLISVVARLGIAVAAGAAGYKIMDEALKDTTDSYLNALPAVDAYIKAQSETGSSVRAPTLQYIEDQKKALDELTKKREEVAKKLSEGVDMLEWSRAAGMTDEELGKIYNNRGMPKLKDDLIAVDNQIQTVNNRLRELNRILNVQTKWEDDNRVDPAKELTDRQKLAIKNAKDTIEETKLALKGLYTSPEQAAYIEGQVKINKSVENFRDALTRAKVEESEVNRLTKEYAENQRKLVEGQVKEDLSRVTTRQVVALKNAKDTVKELTQQYENMYKAPGAKEWGNLQVEISKQIENFRDQLTQAKLPVAQVTELTEKYAQALRKVKEGDYNLQHMTSAFQAFEGIFSRGLDTALSNWIDHVLEGKSALSSLSDVAKAVAQDILKTMLTLSMLNPLKNWLFGTNYNVLGGNAGIGGALGNLLNNIGIGGLGGSPEAVAVAGGVAPAMALGGIVGSSGVKQLRRYSNGGIAHTPQWAEFGEGSTPEAFVPLPDGRSIPVSMKGNGGSPEIHIHESPGSKAQVTSTETRNGTRFDIQIRDMVRNVMEEDYQAGGPISKTHERTFGLNRVNGL